MKRDTIVLLGAGGLLAYFFLKQNKAQTQADSGGTTAPAYTPFDISGITGVANALNPLNAILNAFTNLSKLIPTLPKVTTPTYAQIAPPTQAQVQASTAYLMAGTPQMTAQQAGQALMLVGGITAINQVLGIGQSGTYVKAPATSQQIQSTISQVQSGAIKLTTTPQQAKSVLPTTPAKAVIPAYRYVPQLKVTIDSKGKIVGKSAVGVWK